MIDLHTHSIASDGTYTPSQLVALAEKIKLRALALTDHDCTNGLDEAIQAASKGPIEFIPGIELSATLEDGTLHIVGLYIDHTHPPLQTALERVKKMRTDRNPKIVEKLKSNGIKISIDEVKSVTKGTIVGRPHFAQVLIDKGVVSSANEAFDKYLGSNGLAAVPKERLTPKECIELIANAGGVPILAHPDQTQRKGPMLEALLQELKDYGLAGIEVICPAYTTSQTHEFTRLAKAFNLVRSGGTDFHGANKPKIKLGRGFGSMYIHQDFLVPIRKLAQTV